MEKFYLTTTIPYVNAPPHLGFAMEMVRADTLARYHRLLGQEVFFSTGTDEHGLKIYRQAEEEGVAAQDYVNRQVDYFKRMVSQLGIKPSNFIRTTDQNHKEAAQEFWQRCERNGDIELRIYEAKYCVGCELEKTDSELVGGHCPLHPNQEIELIKEQNYFFVLSNYKQKLLDHYVSHPEFVTPVSRFEEVKNIAREARDFSISRLKEKVPWGVSVPGNEKQIMYVWFDAFVNYISTLGWPENTEQFDKFWSGSEVMTIQLAGKDQLRQQAVMWPAMLMSAGLPLPKRVVYHGFVTSDGQKMSKSLRNVIDPLEVVEKYGVDALRYWTLREANDFEDSDFTWEKFHEAYTANLVNGLGNTTSRIISLAHLFLIDTSLARPSQSSAELQVNLDGYEIKKAADAIWGEIGELDQYIQETVPFKTTKTNPEKAKKDVFYLLQELWKIAIKLEPFLPETSEKIVVALKGNQPIQPLFPRITFVK